MEVKQTGFRTNMPIFKLCLTHYWLSCVFVSRYRFFLCKIFIIITAPWNKFEDVMIKDIHTQSINPAAGPYRNVSQNY